jgi:hypothetical protein
MGILDRIKAWISGKPSKPTFGVTFERVGGDYVHPPPKPKKEPVQPDPVCPYCGFKYEALPKDKKPCPSCGEVVIIKSRDKIKHLLTRTQAQDWEDNKKEQALFNKAVYYLNMGRIDPEKFHLVREGLIDERGVKVTYELAALQILANNSVKRYVKKDYEGAFWTYFAMTHFLRDHGEDYFDTLQLMHETRLREKKTQESNGKVEIKTYCDCDACKPLDGKILTIDEALKTMPFPSKNCTAKFPFHGNYSWVIDY